jgi:hypothetical protein
MRLLSEAACRTWCSTRGLEVSERGYLRYPVDPFHSLVITLPKMALEAVGLANVLSRDLDRTPPRSSLLWLKGWDIWSEDYEEVGANLIRSMRFDKAQLIKDLPGQEFEPAETLDLRTFLLVPIVFQWDAYLVPDHAGYVAFVCHDGFVNILTRTGAERERIFSILEAWAPSREIPAKMRRLVDPAPG